MKMSLVALAACIAVAGCATDGVGYGGSGYVGYDGFYDDHYGPIYGGYWDNDIFYYRNFRGGDFRRDDERHFRRERGEGYHEMHVRGPRRGGGGNDHRGGRGPDRR